LKYDASNHHPDYRTVAAGRLFHFADGTLATGLDAGQPDGPDGSAGIHEYKTEDACQ
jgi:hypothetical protein